MRSADSMAEFLSAVLQSSVGEGQQIHKRKFLNLHQPFKKL